MACNGYMGTPGLGAHAKGSWVCIVDFGCIVNPAAASGCRLMNPYLDLPTYVIRFWALRLDTSTTEPTSELHWNIQIVIVSCGWEVDTVAYL